MKKIRSHVLPAGLLLFLFMNCATSPEPEKITRPEFKPVPFQITDVSVEGSNFNPSLGESAAISFRISKPAKAFVRIFDPDMYLVRELLIEESEGSDTREVIWDGRDMEGNLVPDEAYFFTIESMDYSGNLVYYDPTTVSGGEYIEPEKLEYDGEGGKIICTLGTDARVKISAGISSGGPLLKNILNWESRPAGYNEEPWDGMDASGVVKAGELERFLLMADAVTVPENSIFASGNREYDYITYRNNIAPDRPEKEKRKQFQSELTILGSRSGSLYGKGPLPQFSIHFPGSLKETDEGIPVVNGKTPVKIYLDEKVKRYITEQRYEIIVFADFHFVTEAEEGHSPFTLMWDTRDLKNGGHTLTVVVATLSGQVNSASRKVSVNNE